MTCNLTLPDFACNTLIRLMMHQPVTADERLDMERDYAKLFPLDTPVPPCDDIEHLLDRDGAHKATSATRIIAQWYTMKFCRTPAYMLVQHMGATPFPPSEQDVHTATTALLAHKKQELDALNFARDERDLKNVLPDDVIHVWNTCRTYGIAPWAPLNLPLRSVAYSHYE